MNNQEHDNQMGLLLTPQFKHNFGNSRHFNSLRPTSHFGIYKKNADPIINSPIRRDVFTNIYKSEYAISDTWLQVGKFRGWKVMFIFPRSSQSGINFNYGTCFYDIFVIIYILYIRSYVSLKLPLYDKCV